MDSTELARLEGRLAEAEAAVERARAAHVAAGRALRALPSPEAKAEKLRCSKHLSTVREKLELARTELAVFRATGAEHGLLAREDRVVGTIAVEVPPFATREERAQVIGDALATPLSDAAGSLGVVLAAAPGRYARERPGRDAHGRTILDVAGRVEGDALLPALAETSRARRKH